VARRELEEQLPELEAWSAALDASLVPDPRATGVTGRVLTQTEVSSITVPNILAQIPGVDPEIGHEVVIVGGHFDHLGSDGSDIYYGADDNASGTAVVLELAQLFAEWGAAPARTVLFAGWNAEELGLVGSMYYVIEPTHPLEDTVALINLDMVGGGDELGLIDFGGSDEGSEELYELLASQQDDDFPVTPLESSPNSDHAWFQYAGVPVAFLFTTGAHAHYHTPEDRFDRISGEELEQTTRLSWDVLRILAMGEEQAVLEEAESETQALEAPVAPPVLPPLGLPVSW
jgi:aminopeptidase YwaD